MTTNPIAKPPGSEQVLVENANESEAEALAQPTNIYSERDINSYFYITIGERIFDQRRGAILGEPWVSKTTGLHDFGKFILDDDSGAIRENIAEEDEVLIAVGFGDEQRYEIMSGVISRIGRKLPDGTVVEVKDYSSATKNSTPKIISSKTGEVEADDSASDLELENYAKLNSRGEQRQDLASVVVSDRGLNYDNQSKIITDKNGDAVSGEPAISAAVKEATSVGDRIVTDKKTVSRIAPGSGEQTSLILDYAKNRSVFIASPTVTKRTNNQPEGSGGSWNVEGWNVDLKTKVKATVVVPPKLEYDADRIITILKTELTLGTPIYTDSRYTWGDCTLGGKRIPDNSKIVDRIITLAQTLDELAIEYSEGEKWQIISWYNPNPLGSGSRHELGDAADVFTNNIDKIYANLEPKWQGGLALYPGRLMHIDRRQDSGEDSARWSF